MLHEHHLLLLLIYSSRVQKWPFRKRSLCRLRRWMALRLAVNRLLLQKAHHEATGTRSRLSGRWDARGGSDIHIAHLRSILVRGRTQAIAMIIVNVLLQFVLLHWLFLGLGRPLDSFLGTRSRMVWRRSRDYLPAGLMHRWPWNYRISFLSFWLVGCG